MKFCKDCKYLDKFMTTEPRCVHSNAIWRLDVVTGRIYYMTAEHMRTSTRSECGKEAKLFEQKISWYKKWFQ